MNLEIQPLKESNIELNIQEIELEDKIKKTEKSKIPRLDREARRGNWTGSQFLKLMSSSSKGSRLDWFNKEKIYFFSDGAIKYIFANAMERKTGRYLESDSTKEMKYGTAVEPLIQKRANEYLKKFDLYLEEVDFKTFPNMPTAGVTSDSVVKNRIGEIVASFESKACSSWTTLFERTYEKTDETKKDFWQTQGQMLAWEVNKNYYCVISPPQNINKYLFCDDIMELYEEWCSETEIHIEIIERSPIHLECLEKRIQIAETTVQRFLEEDDSNLKEILYEEIDYWKNQWKTNNNELTSDFDKTNLNSEVPKREKLNVEEDLEETLFPEEEKQNQELQNKQQEIDVDMNNLPF